MPHSKETWLKKAGYTDIVNETNVLFCKDIPCASKASALFSKGYKVALFINSNMLDAGKMNSPSVTPDHWVALTSPILINSFNLQHPGAVNEDPASRIELEVYSWGARHKIPKSGRLTDYNFSINFYGFIACRR